MLASSTLSPRNQLLSALPVNEFQALLPYLKPVEMPIGKVIYQVGEPIEHIYFPENAIVSTVTFFEDGSGIETGITGYEGMTGVSIPLSHAEAPRETNVQAAGEGWKISTENFREAFERGGMFQQLVLRFVFAYFEQVAQSGACINHHPINKRIARWLLMCHDRTEGDEMQITQDFMAQMLGVMRPTVTTAAIELKNEGLIKYSRGIVTVTDRKGLEAVACECYESIKKVYKQYLSALELRNLSQRMERATRLMNAEMQRRRSITSVTNERVEDLKRAVSNIRNLPVRIRFCSKCHKFCDARNNPRSMDDYLGRQINAEFMSVTCMVCATGHS